MFYFLTYADGQEVCMCRHVNSWNYTHAEICYYRHWSWSGHRYDKSNHVMPSYLPGTRWLLPCRRVHPCRCGICACQCAGTSSFSPQERWHLPGLNGTAWWPSSFPLWLTSCSGHRVQHFMRLHRSTVLGIIQRNQDIVSVKRLNSLQTDTWTNLDK